MQDDNSDPAERPPFWAGRHTSPEMRAAVRAGEVPDGPWRGGTNCPQQLHIDAPDGSGGTVDIGRVDNEALADFIVACVNEHIARRA